MEPRARQGMYLGLSSHHSSNVAWVYNLKTKNISPQFHLVFDDNFTTCDTYKTDKLPDNWDNLYKNKRYEIQFDDDNKWHLDSSWDTQETKQTLDTYLPEAAKLPRESMPDLTTIYDTDGKAHPSKLQIEKEAIDQYIQTFIRNKLKDKYPKVFNRRQYPDLKEINNPNHDKHATPKVKQVTKYHRRPRRSPRLYDNKKTGVNIAHLSALKSELGTETNLYRKTMPETHALIASMENNSKLHDNTSNNFDPICLAAAKSKSNPDVLTLSSMRKSPDKEQFETQMTKEIDTMFTKKIFHLVPKNTVPFGK